jgi:ribonuclease R
MVCDMLVTAQGEVHAYQFYPAVMNSHARLTYTEVAAILANTRGPEATQRRARARPAAPARGVPRPAGRAQRRGAVDFDTTETQIVCDENGRIEKIVPRTRNDAHRLIEECMLAANVCAPTSSAWASTWACTACTRAHAREGGAAARLPEGAGRGPERQRRAQPARVPAHCRGHPGAARRRADPHHAAALHEQAIYTPVNSGHFGLAFEAYTHFTSPIRRYPDLLVHRVIKAILGGRKYQLPALPTPGEAHDKLRKRLQKDSVTQARQAERRAEPSPDLQDWEAAGLHCSANERRADEASRDVEAWLKCKYMREHLGEEYAGAVSAVTSFGLFVTLTELYVEGLVHITELGGEYFRYDEVRQAARRAHRHPLRHGHARAGAGQPVDLDARKIDFRLVQEEGAPRDKAGSEGGAGKAPSKPPRGARGGKRARAWLPPPSAARPCRC